MGTLPSAACNTDGLNTCLAHRRTANAAGKYCGYISRLRHTQNKPRQVGACEWDPEYSHARAGPQRNILHLTAGPTGSEHRATARDL